MAILFHSFHLFIRISILLVIYGFLFISFFIWRFSYWLYSGLGDYGRDPLTSKYQVGMIDYYWASVKVNDENISKESNLNGIEKLHFENNILYGKSRNNFVIINTETDKIDSRLNEKEFTILGGNLNKLLTPEKFHSQHFGWFMVLFL